MKKKFKDTKVGKFLVGEKGIFKELGETLPDNGFLGVLKNLISKDGTLTPFEKEKALELLKMDEMEMEQVTKRWEADMSSDMKLAKLTRPLTLIYLTVATSIYIVLDSLDIKFNIDEAWVELLKTLLVTVYVAYFGSRGFEKYQKIRK